MEIQYPNNTKDCNVTYMRTRAGLNWFRIYYKQGCCIRFTPKEVGRVFGIAKFTPTANEIREWAKEMVEKYETQSETQQMEGRGDKTGEIEEKTKEPMVAQATLT
jgi:hypothetical protein